MTPSDTPAQATVQAPDDANARGASTWWQRNKRWFLPVGILVPAVLSISCLGGMALNVFWVVKGSPTYRLMVQRVEADDLAAEKVGRPMRWSLLALGDFDHDPDTGEPTATIVATVTGPRGTAHLQAYATDDSQQGWRLDRLILTPDEGGAVDLVSGEPADPAHLDASPGNE